LVAGAKMSLAEFHAVPDMAVCYHDLLHAQ
jgi:hypothetical protein